MTERAFAAANINKKPNVIIVPALYSLLDGELFMRHKSIATSPRVIYIERPLNGGVQSRCAGPTSDVVIIQENNTWS